MSSPLKPCASCGNGFRGRASASYCSAACKQRAHRARKAGNRNALRLVSVTATPQRPDSSTSPDGGAHSERAVAVLATLDAEQAAFAKQRGEALEWTAREEAVRELVASTLDRIVDLERVYESVMSAESPDGALLVKMSGELRLLETSLARLLKQVSPDLPAEPSRTSQKARQAVRVRWDRERARNV